MDLGPIGGLETTIDPLSILDDLGFPNHISQLILQSPRFDTGYWDSRTHHLIKIRSTVQILQANPSFLTRY